MTGFNRTTGLPLEGFAHVAQSIQVIFTTRIGERVMRRWFGSAAPSLLGRLMTPKVILLFVTTLTVAIDLWEPRFKVSRIILGQNPAESLRLGHLNLVIEGEYRPRGHLRDPTPEGMRRVSLSLTGEQLMVAAV